MDNIRILERTGKGWWAGEEIASILGLSPAAAAVFCSRAVARGDLTKLKRGIYLLPSWIGSAPEGELFRISGILQTPSYVSLTTALSASGATTQIVSSACEAVSTVRSRAYEADGFRFLFVHLPDALFFGFRREGHAFIAEPEKALLDAAYLSSLGRYALDIAALDFGRIDRRRMAAYLKKYPERARRFVGRMMEVV